MFNWITRLSTHVPNQGKFHRTINTNLFSHKFHTTIKTIDAYTKSISLDTESIPIMKQEAPKKWYSMPISDVICRHPYLSSPRFHKELQSETTMITT